MMKLFKKNLNRETFFCEVSSRSYAVTQGGYDCLAEEINNRIDNRFIVDIKYNHLIDNVMVTFEYVEDSIRSYCFAFSHGNMRSDISRIEDVLTAFACGLGLEC